MSLLSPGLVLPLTPTTEPHLFLDDPFFEQTRHHFDLTVKQMSNRWSLGSPDHLSSIRSLHQNSDSKEDSSEPGAKQHKIIQIQIETDDGDDLLEGNETKVALSGHPECSSTETSTTSETSSTQEIRDQDPKAPPADEPAEGDAKLHSLVGGLSLHRTLLPTLHKDPFFDDSFFRDVQSDFEETFDSILHGNNAKTSSKTLEGCLSTPDDEAVSQVEINAQPENTSDQKDAVGDQGVKECDSKVKGDKCLVEEGQGGKTCAGSVFPAPRPRPTQPRLARHNAIDKSFTVEKTRTNQEENKEKDCQDEAHIIPDKDEDEDEGEDKNEDQDQDKTDLVGGTEELSHQDTDEHSEMQINEELCGPLLRDEENQQTKIHLESSLDTIMEEPCTPMQDLQEDKDIFKENLFNEQRNEEDKREQDSNSQTLTLDNSELIKQDSIIDPEMASVTVSNQKLDQPNPLQKEETQPFSSQQELDSTLPSKIDLSGVSPVELESVSTPLSDSLKPDTPGASNVITRPKETQGNVMKGKNGNEGIKEISEESEEIPCTSQQTSPQSKRNSRVRFEDLPEQQDFGQHKRSSKTQNDDNQQKSCIKEQRNEKKDQDRKNKKLHLYIPDIKTSNMQSDNSCPLDLGQQKSPLDGKSLEQSLQQGESKQKVVQAPTCDNKTPTSCGRMRTEPKNTKLSDILGISKPETSLTDTNSNKESQKDLTNKTDSYTQKPKNDTDTPKRNTCNSEKTILTSTNPKDGELLIQRRGSFFRDSTFKDDHKHFRSAVSKVLERFGIRSSADDELIAYKTLRQWISVGESQAAKFIDGKTNYKVVLDMSDFADVKVKLDGQILVVEGLPLRKEANSSQISRRCFIFPTSVEMGSVTSALSSDGVLTVTGPKRQRYSFCQEDAIR